MLASNTRCCQRRQHGRRLRPDTRGKAEVLEGGNRTQENRRARHDDQRVSGAFATLGSATRCPQNLQPSDLQPSTFDYTVVPFDQIFKAVREGQADTGHHSFTKASSPYQNEGFVVCEDLGVWWGRENDGLPCPSAKRHSQAVRSAHCAQNRFRHSRGQYSL